MSAFEELRDRLGEIHDLSRAASLLAWDAQRLVRAGSDPAAAVAAFAAEGFAPFCVAAGDPEGGESLFECDRPALSAATVPLRRS